MDWKLYSFVVRGKNRTRILTALTKPMTPTQLKEKAGVSLSHVSHALRVLKEKGLAKCINPKDKVGKLYRLTKKGKEIAKAMEK